MSDKKCVWKFHVGSYHMGRLDGLFVATKQQIEASYGLTAHFGEVLGKHSDVYVTLEASHFEFVTDEQIAVRVIEKYDLSQGFDPLDTLFTYLTESTHPSEWSDRDLDFLKAMGFEDC